MYGFDPIKAIIIQFKPAGEAVLSYSNLNERYLRSTSEGVDNIYNDFKTNYQTFNYEVYEASYQTFPDQEYSCTDGLMDLFRTGFYQRLVVNGTQVNTTQLSGGHWHTTEPECYAERTFGQTVDYKKADCVDGWCSGGEVDGSKGPVHADVCNRQLGVCRSYVTEFKEQESQSKFWNLHIFPKVEWHPRHHISGRIIVEETLTDTEMKKMRKKALKYQDDENLKKYLKPALSKESVVFSAQFVLPENTSPNQITELDFDLVARNDDETSYYRDPPRAYRVMNGFQDIGGIKRAVMLPFADEDNFEWVGNLDSKCPGWEYKDKLIGENGFIVNENLEVTIPQYVPQDVRDPRWWEYTNELVEELDGSKKIVYRRKLKDKLSGQTGLVRNPDFPYQDYWWKGCPDIAQSSFLPYTKRQIKQVLFAEIPKCDPSRLEVYQGIFLNIAQMVYRYDPEEYEMAMRRHREAGYYLERLGTAPPAGDRQCSEYPIDVIAKGWGY